MVKSRLIILTAVLPEARAIASALGLPTPEPGRPLRTNDTVFPVSVELHIVGIRAVRMPQASRGPLVRGVLMAGLAGGLDPSLEIGDIVVDDCPSGIPLPMSFRKGKIVVSASLVSTPAQKQSLFIESNALAVDMESAVARQFALESGVPFMSIRAISDTASQILNPAVLGLIDEFGRPKPLAIAGTLLRQPKLIPYLRELKAASAKACDNLAKAMVNVISAWTIFIDNRQ